jgi:serine O-acetyltransferase
MVNQNNGDAMHEHPHGIVREPLQALFARLDEQERNVDGCLPQKGDVHALANGLFNFLFPINCTQHTTAETRFGVLHAQLTNVIRTALQSDVARAQAVADAFMAQMPEVFATLQDDVDASFKFDPAAFSRDEIITTYPGIFAIAVYRLAHLLRHLDVPIVPRMLTEYAHSKTGIDINPGAEIGRSFFIDHGTGIVIGETAEIGNNVKLYQGVTLGALQVEKALASKKRHPTIGDNVIIYAGATILGGETLIGHDSVIGGNVFLTESIQPFSLVYHKSEISVRQRNAERAINFVI